MPVGTAELELELTQYARLFAYPFGGREILSCYLGRIIFSFAPKSILNAT